MEQRSKTPCVTYLEGSCWCMLPTLPLLRWFAVHSPICVRYLNLYMLFSNKCESTVVFTNQIAEHSLGLSTHFRCEMFTFGVGPRPLTLPYANSTRWSGLRVVYCVQWWNVYHFQPTHSRTGTPRHTQTRTQAQSPGRRLSGTVHTCTHTCTQASH